MALQKGLVNRLRLGVQRVLHRALFAAMAKRYSFIFPQAHRVYSPWYEPAFLARVAALRAWTLLSEDRLWLLQRLVEHCRNLPGDMAECGIYKGGSARLIAETLDTAGGTACELHLFDSFEGMPVEAQEARDSHSQGDFSDTSAAAVRTLLASFPFVRIHEGFIPRTFAGLEERVFSFVHVDVDIYSTTLDCLRFFHPRMSRGGVILFDDYGFRIYERAEKQAVDDYLADKPEKPIVLPNGQAMLLKL